MALSKEEKEHRKLKREKDWWNKNHKIIDGIDHKLCHDCEKWIPSNLDYFYKDKNSNDGITASCKECRVERQRKYYHGKGKEIHKNSSKRYKEENRDYYISYNKDWRSNNKEYVSNYQKEHQQNNPDKWKIYNKNRKHKNHIISKKEWTACKLYFDNSCAYCGLHETEHKELYNQQLHKEHVVHDGSIYLDNCVPSCRNCNSQKWEYDMEKWYREQEFFIEEKLNIICKWLTEDYKLHFEGYREKRKHNVKKS